MELTIRALGVHGDGVAECAGETVHVPFALPGERVVVERQGKKARLIEVIEAAPDRSAPACRHFGTCGGCSLQHMAAPAYRNWKVERVAAELARHGLDVPLADLVACPPQSRRRATFTIAPVGGKPAIGYHAAGSHRLVPIDECPVLTPAIVARLPVLRELGRLAGGAAAPLRVLVTQTASGTDVAIDGARSLGEGRRQSLVRIALDNDLARLAVNGEIVVQARPPQLAVGKAALVPPPGGFLQATAVAEEEMAALVSAHLAGSRRVADLFSGSGAFALRLAEFATVQAVESDAGALAALDSAFRGAKGLKRIVTERRDLERRPLSAAELDRFDGLVFDPPRAGAAAQAGQIARSKVAKVAAVSCNPATLARDLALLRNGGYSITRVIPVDQFLWSAHVEAVALAERG